jgi:hypothetical protein
VIPQQQLRYNTGIMFPMPSVPKYNKQKVSQVVGILILPGGKIRCNFWSNLKFNIAINIKSYIICRGNSWGSILKILYLNFMFY